MWSCAWSNKRVKSGYCARARLSTDQGNLSREQPVLPEHTEGESLSAEDIALPTATEGREPGLASMGTIWTWSRWISSLPTLLPSLRGWMVDAQQYHVPRGVCKKSIIPAAHHVHSDQSLSSLEDVWHTQGAGI